MLSDEERAFIDIHRVARLATADADGAPHVLPICFVVIDHSLFLTIDEKPKSGNALQLKRVRNIIENPHTAVVIDQYDDDWTRLGWVMLRGSAEVIAGGAEHEMVQLALKARYPQYREMRLSALPVIAVRIERVTRWGNLSVAGAK